MLGGVVKIVSGTGLARTTLSFCALVAATSMFSGLASAQEPSAPPSAGQDEQKSEAPQSPKAPVHLDINEYRIEGTRLLPQETVEEIVYPFLGPDRTTDDVESARAALQKAYEAAGYQTVAVQIPPQRVRGGVITLKVVEGPVGRLSVKGSRYFDIEEIKADAPSLAEGKVPNFRAVQHDIVALNQQPDRRVTPALRAGATPGTVDVDLNVDDTLPLHASVEYNNRYSVNTTQQRIMTSVHYDNLWQLGHSLNFSYQVAPQRVSDSQVYSLSYLARIPRLDWLSLLAYGVKQDSDVSTLGAINVTGRGQIAGGRAIVTLPFSEGFFHTLSFGADYKHFDQGVTYSGQVSQSPITYVPITADYNATWVDTVSTTQLDANLTFHLRGVGSGAAEFDNKRLNSTGNFAYLRGSLSRTQHLPWDFQLYGKVQGQLSSAPLVSAEELSVGGLDTVRGYLESEVIGDNGGLGSFELRSPYIPGLFGFSADKFVIDDWRFYLFGDAGLATVNSPMSEQQATFYLASIGGGSRIRLFRHLNGSIDAGVPLLDQAATKAHVARLGFRVWIDY